MASRSARLIMGFLGAIPLILVTAVSAYAFLAGRGFDWAGPVFGLALFAYLYLIPRSVLVTMTTERLDYRGFDGLRWRHGSIAARSVTGFRTVHPYSDSFPPAAVEVSDKDSAATHKILLGSLDPRDCDLVLGWLDVAGRRREP